MNLIESVLIGNEKLGGKFRGASIVKVGAKKAVTASTLTALDTALDLETGYQKEYTVPTDKKFKLLLMEVRKTDITTDQDTWFKVRGQYMNSCIRLANAMKATLNAHFADEDEHTAGAQDAITIPDATDLTSLKALIGAMLTAYAAHDDDAILEAGWEYHIAQGTERALASAEAPTTIAECKARVDDLKANYNLHDADAVSHTQGTQHQEATGNTGTTDVIGDVLVSDSGSTKSLSKVFDVSGTSGVILEGEAVTLAVKSTDASGEAGNPNATFEIRLTGVEYHE